MKHEDLGWKIAHKIVILYKAGRFNSPIYKEDVSGLFYTVFEPLLLYYVKKD